MNKPKNYDETQALTESRVLPAGGYVCKIMSVEETKSKAGNEMLVISLDIAEGEFKDFYKEKYKADTRKNKKWGCVVYQLTLDIDGNCSRGFKGFTTSVEESNDGFKIEWGDNFCNGFKDKLVGGLFGKEEFEANDGNIVKATKCRFFRSVKSIRDGDFKIPEDKPFNSDSKKPAYAVSTVDEDDLPF